MRKSLMSLLRVAAMAAFIGTAVCVQAQAPAGTEQLKPYLQVKPVVGEEATVRAFFSPHCEYSKMYFIFFRNLGATLPDGRRFEFTPLINRGDGLGYALSFLAVRRYYPQFVNNFVEASLLGAQDRGISTLTWSGIDRIGRAARIPTSVPALVHDHADELRSLLAEALRVQRELAVTNTPSVAVAGTYIITPEFTNGDAALFSQLVNGIISMSQ